MPTTQSAWVTGIVLDVAGAGPSCAEPLPQTAHTGRTRDRTFAVQLPAGPWFARSPVTTWS